jgi:hypothetical protein
MTEANSTALQAVTKEYTRTATTAGIAVGRMTCAGAQRTGAVDPEQKLNSTLG